MELRLICNQKRELISSKNGLVRRFYDKTTWTKFG
jgi:hypothetical protein